MIRNIHFTGRTGCFDVPSFLLTDNEDLTLVFNVQEYRQGKFVVVIKHGNARMTVHLTKEKRITLTADWLKENGAVPLEILLELRTVDLSRVIIPNANEKGGFFIGPLLIEKIDDSFTAVGWLQKIESGMAEQASKIKELQSIVDGIPGEIEKAKNEAIVEATGGDVMNG